MALSGIQTAIVTIGLILFVDGPAATSQERTDLFEVQVVDRATGRGIPMVELVTVDEVVLVTDNAGRVAIDEPQLWGQTVFYFVRSAGYEVPKDGFGISGVRFQLSAGGRQTIEMDRVNLAERLYRITGRDLYRDSVMLKHPSPIRFPFGPGQVVGQDSVQAAPYRNSIRWFWGDTSRLAYPLGLFRTAGAVTGQSSRPENDSVDVVQGIDFEYFVDEKGFARAMVDVPNAEGVVWIDGVCTVTDGSGTERLVAHFSRRKGLADQLEHGILLYNDQREIFEVASTLPLDEDWRFIRDHPTRSQIDSVDYLMFGNPFPVTRVPATLEAVLDVERYESYSCSASEVRNKDQRPRRLADGRVDWRWQHTPPTTQQVEDRWIRTDQLKAKEAHYLPTASSATSPSGPRVMMHSGTVHFNAHRNRWVMIAVQYADVRENPSFLGEVWYSEAIEPQGPYERAIKIATHPKQTFYNPCHHRFFDEEGGRRIYFEGTYCNTFTDSPATPRYNYNQMMYRLDLQQAAILDIFGSVASSADDQ